MKCKLLAAIAAALCPIFFLASCQDDPHDPDVELSGEISGLVPSYSVDLTSNYRINNRHIRIEAVPHIYINLDRWKLRLDKVSYYIDNVLLETRTAEPYMFVYESDDWHPGAHSIKAELTISGDNVETMVIPCTKVIDNSTAANKAADIYFDYNFVTVGDELCLNVMFNPARSAAGTTISGVSAYFDGVTIGHKTAEPFQFKKYIIEDPGSKHGLEATVYYDCGEESGKYGMSTNSVEICGPSSVCQSYNICSRYRDYRNGETLIGKAHLFKGSEVSANYGLKIYLDDKMIAESREFPYQHEYVLTGLPAGVHTVKSVWERCDGNWTVQGSVSSEEVITIIE